MQEFIILTKKPLKELPNVGDIEKTLFPDYAKKEKLSTIKFTNSKWYSVDSFQRYGRMLTSNRENNKIKLQILCTGSVQCDHHVCYFFNK